MDIKECYVAMGGDYSDVVSRLRTDERITKFLLRVLDDGNMKFLCDCIADKNLPEAFRAAHTLKGICMNLSLTALYTSVASITEALRGREEYGDDLLPLLEVVKRDYALTMDCISALKESAGL